MVVKLNQSKVRHIWCGVCEQEVSSEKLIEEIVASD